jgi:heterodisulfide reductase subunit A2
MMGAPRIGVFVCECGVNIAATVDVEAVVSMAAALPGVVVARRHKYTCSEPGQRMIQDDIRDLGLDRVVVASCSPRMHEATFRRTLESAGLNPYYLEMANIREHVSWVVRDRDMATEKAIRLVRSAVARVRLHVPLEPRQEPVTKGALVIGGGIAGIQAALSIADSGYPVYLVEREPSIGGRMAQLDKTIPTLDCST